MQCCKQWQKMTLNRNIDAPRASVGPPAILLRCMPPLVKEVEQEKPLLIGLATRQSVQRLFIFHHIKFLFIYLFISIRWVSVKNEERLGGQHKPLHSYINIAFTLTQPHQIITFHTCLWRLSSLCLFLPPVMHSCKTRKIDLWVVSRLNKSLARCWLRPGKTRNPERYVGIYQH